jgi:hypothetical protein
MATLRTGQTTDYSSQGTEFSVASKSTDSSSSVETRYTPNFEKWHGYYRNIPELRAVINKFASWTFGRGIKADEKNKAKLDKIKGFGKDSPRSVLKNCWRVALICGDSFAHIIKDNQGRITNLKPMGNLTIVANEEGIIVGYEDMEMKRYDPEEIYHLSYERVADEIHGIPFPEALEELTLARNEGIADLRELYHKVAFPTDIYEAETDDTTKLNSITTTLNSAFKKRESIVIPAGVFKEIKKVSTGQNATLDSLPFVKFIVRNFVSSCGMPEIIMGWGEDTTEASAKIIYLAFQQEIEDMQLYNQEQIEAQLGIEIELEFPADLMEAQAAGVAQGLQSTQEQITSPASFKKDGGKTAVEKADVRP